MFIRFIELRHLFGEAAKTVASLPNNVRFFETGNQFVHYIYLIDETKMPDIETALLGGISISEYGGPWGVGSVSSHEGYGPMLYRLAMEWVAENAKGRGLTKNRGGETSDAAQRVWKKFDDVSRDASSDVFTNDDGDPMSPEYLSRTGELKKMRMRWIQLTQEQMNSAWGMLTSLEIGGQQKYDEEETQNTSEKALSYR